MGSIHEKLTEQFYAWEQRGRGWQVFGESVVPEPPFRPFYDHNPPRTEHVDDGRRHTVVSSLTQTISQKLSTYPPPPSLVPVAEEEPEPQSLFRDSLVELQVALPADFNLPKEAFEQLLLNLSMCREPIAFELVGVPNLVTAQFAMCAADAPVVRRQLQAYFPEGMFQAREGTMEEAWNACEGDATLIVEFGLAREFMLPLASGKLDPFIGMVGALAELQLGQVGLYQVLFQPVHHPWTQSITRSVTHTDGSPFFVNRQELTDGAKKKILRPLYGAVVRIAVRSQDYASTLQLVCDLAGCLRVFGAPQGNELIPLTNADYPFEEHLDDMLLRQSRRSGMLLNIDELIGFVHLPSSGVRSPVLQRYAGKTKAAPAIVRKMDGLFVGTNVHGGESVPVRLTTEQRVRHTHIIGVSGTGKSTLLFNLIRQDIENGEGVALLDPHGDLVDKILGIIPPSRIEDVILVDASDEHYSVGFNILSAHSELEKNLLASDLVASFQRLSTSWGDQMGSVLQNAILAFLESELGGTIADVRRFLIEPAFRDQFLKTVRNPEIIYYWRKTFGQLAGNKSIGSVVTRLDTFLSRKSIQYMVSQRVNRLDFSEILDTGKIFLAKLPQGQMGTKDSFLLGSLLVSKFQQLAMARQAQEAAIRKDFWLYIDEFQNFITPSMTEILTGARKYRLGMTLAHHELRQLQRDSELASAVMAHPHTRVIFRVGGDDSRKLADGLASFEARDLQNLENFQAICRVERSGYDFNLTVPFPEAPDCTNAARRQEVLEASRKRYGTPRANVEAELFKSYGLVANQEAIEYPTKASPLPTTVDPKSAETKSADGPKIAPPVAADETTSAMAPADDESKHVAFQKKVRPEAESLDYNVTVEESYPKASLRVDLVLRRGKQTIACQYTATTPVDLEVANVHKCIAVGFSRVAVICVNRKKLERIQQALADTASTDQMAKVGFYAPEEFISRLHDWAADDPEGTIIEKGKPKKRYFQFGATQPTVAEQKLTEQQMLDAIKKAMKPK